MVRNTHFDIEKCTPFFKIVFQASLDLKKSLLSQDGYHVTHNISLLMAEFKSTFQGRPFTSKFKKF
jgi:hypothetical protein